MKRIAFPIVSSLSLLMACGGPELHINEHHTAPAESESEDQGGAEGAAGAEVAGPPELRALPSAVSYNETVNRLGHAITAAGLSIIQQLDHAQNAQEAGLELRPTTVFIFGNPSAGTPLMHENPTMALDFPQRILVYSTGAHEVFVVWRPPSTLALDHGAEADERHHRMDALMETLGAAAAGPAPQLGARGAPR
ncbi:MAG: hypothetical protein DRJ42_03460 [Deltaproteobacteria bacterium]|nr:MAG: hypothetical protein DRJ42_03460 [Deltaproteobacteria bacterium]